MLFYRIKIPNMSGWSHQENFRSQCRPARSHKSRRKQNGSSLYQVGRSDFNVPAPREVILSTAKDLSPKQWASARRDVSPPAQHDKWKRPLVTTTSSDIGCGGVLLSLPLFLCCKGDLSVTPKGYSPQGVPIPKSAEP